MGFIFDVLLEDPVLGPVLYVYAIGRRFNINSSIDLIQRKARERAEQNNPNYWKQIARRKDAHLAEFGICPAAKL